MRLSDGRQLRMLTVVDMYTRACVALEEGATHFRGEDVARVLMRAIAERGRPAAIQCDNGTKFTSRVGVGRAVALQPAGEVDRQRDQRGLQRQRPA